MPTVHAFHVVPALPEPLQDLRTLAFNLRWAWDNETIDLFQRLDRDFWEQSGHNPVLMLGTINQERLQDAAQDEAFLAQMDRIARGLENYMRSPSTWFRRTHPELVNDEFKIAYFSMEFGLTESLPIYSGGLGVLAGDHLKSSSDLGIPLVAVGLLYQQGYFRQRLSADGWQQENYPENDFYNLPLKLQTDAQGEPLRISVAFPGREVFVQVWCAQVGRVPLYLLDTNIAPNSPDDQNITDQLYGGDIELRLKQEIILGIGGLRALKSLGISPTICHMNEGHAAFLALERVRMLRESHALNYLEAQEATASGNLFTTHTPVPAGFDVFSKELLEKYFTSYLEGLGITFEEFLGLGRVHRFDTSEQFNMAILALRHSHQVNGVSRLHGVVTRKMVQSGYPGFPEEEVPVSYVTNGIHIRSFLSSEMAELFDRYLGARWVQDIADNKLWEKAHNIPDEEIWRVRTHRRDLLVQFARARLKHQYEQRGMSEYEIRQVREVLSPHILTIGFARRFATYKRANLLLSDPDRLLRLLNDSNRPVQILFAGKAHPRDDGGKEIIQEITKYAAGVDVRNRIVFLEDYDMGLARQLVQGVDVWLNTPRRPMEASGTSGMKVLPNGGLNLSIPDGWWAEAYDPRVGWSIGKGEEYDDPVEQDRRECQALYDILEKEVVPLFYDRTTDDLPRAWIARIKNSMRTLCPVYNTHRMVSEYAERFYFPAAKRQKNLADNDLENARSLVAWKLRMSKAWPNVKVEQVETDEVGADQQNLVKSTTPPLRVGAILKVKASVRLGDLTPEDVTVQAVHGGLDSNHVIVQPKSIALAWNGMSGTDPHGKDGLHRYEGEVPCSSSGLQGFSVRVLPCHPDAALPLELALIAWE